MTTFVMGQSISLSLGSGAGAAGGSVSLPINLTSSGGAQTAAMQWTFSYPGGITGVTVAAGSVATNAQKTISCNGNTCLIYGLNQNIIADGLSMAAGNYLSIRSHESVLEAEGLPEEEASPFRHAVATFLAFVVAGTIPLTPYMVPSWSVDRFALSIVLTLAAMFAVGASRAFISKIRWCNGGFEMLGLGTLVSALAYGSGRLVAGLIGG